MTIYDARGRKIRWLRVRLNTKPPELKLVTLLASYRTLDRRTAQRLAYVDAMRLVAP